MAHASASVSKPRAIAYGLLLTTLPLLSGCDFLERLNREIEALKVVVTGGKSPLATTAPSPSPAPEELGANAQRSKINGELLHEMVQVVLMREPKPQEYSGYVDVLNQGASIEGLYNGFTHSADYRKQEVSSGAASPTALKLFAELLAGIESEMPRPTQFDESSSKPLQVIDESSEGASNGAALGNSVITFGDKPSPSPSPVNTAGLADQYAQQFVGASIFTLKRVLGDEALKLITTKHDYAQKLALWYSKWVVQMTSKGVDFGLELRNKADEKFHFDWAVKTPEDRLKWEVLNRLHRMLNEAERKSH